MPHIPDSLIRAIIEVESGGNIFAVRYEPGYRYLWDIKRNEPYRGRGPSIPTIPGCTRATEHVGQQTSWGPMQIMGATAREIGFRGWFPELCDEVMGCALGTDYLERLTSRFFAKHGWEGVVAAYNAGSPRRADNGDWVNQVYIDKVTRAGGLR